GLLLALDEVGGELHAVLLQLVELATQTGAQSVQRLRGVAAERRSHVGRRLDAALAEVGQVLLRDAQVLAERRVLRAGLVRDLLRQPEGRGVLVRPRLELARRRAEHSIHGAEGLLRLAGHAAELERPSTCSGPERGDRK